MPLTRQTIRHPAEVNRHVWFFRHVDLALSHLRDHLLTAPEALAWAVVMPAYRDILDPEDGDARWRCHEAARASEGESAQPLYDLYARACDTEARDAGELGWYRGEGNVTVALGTSGVLLVVEQALTTAFLPGQGTPEATQQARAAPQATGLSRERGMRAGRPGRYDHEAAARQRRESQQRQARRPWLERLYHDVFRKALQFVRRCHYRQRDLTGQLLRCDYALLKEVLPPRSQLDYAGWVELRRRCRGEEGPT